MLVSQRVTNGRSYAAGRFRASSENLFLPKLAAEVVDGQDGIFDIDIKATPI